MSQLDKNTLTECIGCGCDDMHGCIADDGTSCWWLRKDMELDVGVCSECTEVVPRWDQGERRMLVPFDPLELGQHGSSMSMDLIQDHHEIIDVAMDVCNKVMQIADDLSDEDSLVFFHTITSCVESAKIEMLVKQSLKKKSTTKPETQPHEGGE